MAENKVFLYTSQEGDQKLFQTAREELERLKVPFEETDLTGKKLDDEWPALPVISSLLGFTGGFKDPETLKKWLETVSHFHSSQKEDSISD